MLLGFICFKSLASDKHVIKEVFVVVATLNAVFENLLLALNIAKQILHDY